jgi:hypothetical protein
MGRSVVSRKDVEQFNKSLSTPGEMERRYRDDQKIREETERRYEEHLPAPEGPKHLNDEQLQEERNRLSKKLEHEQLAYEQPESGRVYAAPSIEQKSEKPVIDQSPSVPLEADTYTSRLLKYIPAEVIALYLTLDAIIRSSQETPMTIYWAIFGVGLVGTYLYLWRVAKVRKQVQLLLSVTAYCVWAFALGGPFTHLGWYDPLYGGLLLPVYTFVVAIVEA